MITLITMLFALVSFLGALVASTIYYLFKFWWVILIVFVLILIMAKISSNSPNSATTSSKEQVESERERYWKAHPGEKRELLAQREKMRQGLYKSGISNREREYFRRQLKEINNKLWEDQ